MQMKVKLILFYVVSIMICLSSISKMIGAESIDKQQIYVDDDADPGWYDATHVRTIQEGIYNASVGDTVLVYNGTYFEKIDIPKSINLIGENTQNTIFDNQGGGGDFIDVSANNVMIKGFSFRNSSGRFIDFSSSDYLEISNNIFDDASKALYLISSSNNLIHNCTFRDISYATIEVYQPSGGLYSNDNIISNCSFLNVYTGLLVQTEFDYAGESTFKNNLFVNNTLVGCDWGMYLMGALYHPEILDDNEFKRNLFINNGKAVAFGIGDFGNNNTFYLNNFIENNKDVYGEHGTWDNGTYGNYWDSYDGNDSNDDGIGDSPHLVKGSTYDNFPLMNPSVSVPFFSPLASFDSYPINPTTLDVINFTDNSIDYDGIIVNWSWSFGDGNSSYIQHPTHQYADIGEYAVNLTVEDDDGDTDTIEKIVTVHNVEPIAGFSWVEIDNYSICFNDSSEDIDGFIVDWYWDFDDGNTSVLQHPTHVYGDDDVYNVSLTVTDDDGVNDTFNSTIIVSNPTPTCDFTYEPSTPTTYQTIYFNSTSSDRSIVNWSWNMGDGTILYGAQATHYYVDDGSYNVCLEVTDDDGATDVVCKTISVDNTGPIANFTYTPINPIMLSRVYFTDTSIDPDGDITSWFWDFGEGDTSTEQHPSNIFVNEGNYTVCLTVTDDDGKNHTYCQIINVISGLDVNQTLFDRGFPIRHAVDGDWAGAQSFTPIIDTLTRVEIILRKFGTPEFNLSVELRTDHPQGSLIDSRTYTPDQVSSSWEMFEVNFNDTTVQNDTEYFIVIPPAPSGVTTSFGYEWGYAFGNQYDDGSFWFTRDGGGLWRDLPTMYEFAFRTFGYS